MKGPASVARTARPAVSPQCFGLSGFVSVCGAPGSFVTCRYSGCQILRYFYVIGLARAVRAGGSYSYKNCPTGQFKTISILRNPSHTRLRRNNWLCRSRCPSRRSWLVAFCSRPSVFGSTRPLASSRLSTFPPLFQCPVLFAKPLVR